MQTLIHIVYVVDFGVSGSSVLLEGPFLNVFITTHGLASSYWLTVAMLDCYLAFSGT